MHHYSGIYHIYMGVCVYMRMRIYSDTLACIYTDILYTYVYVCVVSIYIDVCVLIMYLCTDVRIYVRFSRVSDISFDYILKSQLRRYTVFHIIYICIDNIRLHIEYTV